MWQYFISLEAKEQVVVLSAVISATVTIIISIITGIRQSKWNKKKIDADLKAKARIDWIQKVRECTAALLSTYYAILNETNKEELFEKIQIAKKNSEILSLYFGDTGEKTGEIDQHVLENSESNKNKNSMIVLSIESIFEKFNTYYKNEINDTRFKLQEALKKADIEMRENLERWEVYGVYETPDGEFIEQKEPIYNPEYKKAVDEIQQRIRDYNNSVKELTTELNGLRNHIRLYLKIEWDIAKNGK